MKTFETSSARAAKAFATAAAAWKFRPFLRQGQPMPVCAMLRLSHREATAPTVVRIPLPPPPSRDGSEPVMLGEHGTVTEAKRIRGSQLIVPDDLTKTHIALAKRSRLEGTFRICLDKLGRPESILPMRSTGFAAYDRKLLAGMQSWLYSPFLVDGVAHPVCTGVTFIYTQRSTRRGR